MTGAFDVSSLMAPDAVAAVRSFPRRYRGAITAAFAADPCTPAELMGRSGADGVTVGEHLQDTVSTLGLLEQALRQVLRSDDPALHPAVLDPAQRVWDLQASVDLDTLLAMLDDQCDDLAALMDAAPNSDWGRTGHIADGAKVEAITLAREAARVGAVNLRALEAALANAS